MKVFFFEVNFDKYKYFLKQQLRIHLKKKNILVMINKYFSIYIFANKKL